MIEIENAIRIYRHMGNDSVGELTIIFSYEREAERYLQNVKYEDFVVVEGTKGINPPLRLIAVYERTGEMRVKTLKEAQV